VTGTFIWPDLLRLPSSVVVIIYALAVYRATRLITTDALCEPIRRWLRRLGWTRMSRAIGIDGDVEVDDVPRRGPRGAFGRGMTELVRCDWCLSIWLGAVAVGASYEWETWTGYISATLALSAVTGVLRERVA
jgi:hypothetical protein